MVKLRLQRFGAHKSPFYRIVATSSTNPRDGKFLEIVGTYDPIKGLVDVKADLASKWLDNGAQPTTTVKSLFKKYHVLEKKG
jgi:small subunit ribosomal protein S16